MSATELTVEGLEADLRRVRSGAGRKFVSNFFAPREQWPVWIERGLKRVAETDSFVLLCRPEAGCVRLFFGGNRDGMGAALEKLPRSSEGPWVVDLIGRPADVQELEAGFLAHGFQFHLKLVRLGRLGAFEFAPAEGKVDGSCEPAALGDGEAILEMLRKHFDVYADQLPGLPEIQSAIRAGNLRVFRSGGQLGGFLWFEKAGVTGSIRYWCVDSAFRGLGVGGRLMRDYFLQTDGCGRHLLWVRENNVAAVACYEHYGYKPDGLEDHILVLRD